MNVYESPTCKCGRCVSCEFSMARALRGSRAERRRAAKRVELTRPGLQVSGPARLAQQTGLPVEEVHELLRAGRTAEDILFLGDV